MVIVNTFTVSQGVGRPVVGLTSDWLGPINVASAVTLVASLATLFIWIFAAKTLAGAIIFALFGTFTGNLFGMIGPVTVEVIGIKLLPSGTCNSKQLKSYTVKRLTIQGCRIRGLFLFSLHCLQSQLL